MVKKIVIGILLFAAGVGVGFGILFLLGTFLRFDHPLLSMFGVRKPQIVGFLPYWLLVKADRQYDSYITTLSYFGLTVDVDGKPIFLVNPQEEDPGWTALRGAQLDALRESAKKKNIKMSLLVHSADDEKITQLLVNPEQTAHALVSEVAPIMKSRGFGDLNLDIESFTPASESARAAFTMFVSTVAADVRQAALGTLTVEIPPIALTGNYIIDPQAVGAIADYIVLMTYDYHYLGSYLAGPVAPIGGGGEIREFDVEMSVKEAINVIAKEKLLLGIPLYGYQWETVSEKPGAATIPSGASTASSRRVAELLAGCATCSASLDPVSGEPVVVYQEGDYYNQIYYENQESLAAKLALASRYQLGGVALWALGYEDDALLVPLAEYKKTFQLLP